MDRISYIEQLSNQPAQLEAKSFINALVRCLEPDESVELLRRSLAGNSLLRGPALRKVCSDIATGKIIDPPDLIFELKEIIVSGEPRRREGYAHCLLEVSRACGSETRMGVQAFLGASKYVGLRRRSYKLYDPDLHRSRQLLEDAWRGFNDYEAAWLIVRTFPSEFLVGNKAILVSVLTEGWQLSKFYLRIAEIEPSVIDELFEIDPISFVYVKAKVGQPISKCTLSAIFDASLGDERLGLLLWSMGELKQWDQLVEASARTGDIVRARFPPFADNGI